MQIINKIKHNFLNNQARKLLIQSYALLFSAALIMSIVSYIIAGYIGLVIAVLMLVQVCIRTLKIPISETLSKLRATPLNFTRFANLYQLQSALLTNAKLKSIPQLYSMPSNSMNAFAIGTDNASAIVFTEAMLNRLDTREIGGVLAHEIAHIKNHDLILMNISNALWRFTHNLCQLSQVLVLLMIPLIFFGILQMSLSSLLFLFFAPFLAILIHLALSRTREFEADRVASELSGDPKGLAMALKKLDSQKFNWWKLLFNYSQHYQEPEPANYLKTHPPTRDRIDKLLSYPVQQGAYWRVLHNYNHPKAFRRYDNFNHSIGRLNQIISRFLWNFSTFRRF